MLTRLSVAADLSCSQRASGSPAASPQQPPTASASAGGKEVPRPTYAGKGALQQRGSVLAPEHNRVLSPCAVAFP